MSNATVAKVSFPRLDPLRAICFILVFFAHGLHTNDPIIRDHWSMHLLKGRIFGSGNLGVLIFFVLSGFLITYLLIAERRLMGRIDVRKFWLRRMLRIWPLYYACVAFGFLVFPVIKQAMHVSSLEVAHPFWYLTFINNFDLILHGRPDASNLDVLWSIAVEEQFYLVWPLLLLVLPERVYPHLFGSLILGSWVFSTLHPTELMIHYHTLARMGDLACGAMGAWIMSSDRGLAWIRARTRGQVLAAHLPFLVLYFACGYLEMHTMNGMANHRLLFAFASTIVVVWQAANMTSWLALPNWRPLAYMGRISYGLYCLHPIGLLVAVQGQHLMGWDTQVWQVVVLQSVIALSFTIALAAFSYRFYESPFLRLKQRLSHIRR